MHVNTRMHSSRMRTTRSNSHLLWGVSASVHAGIPPGCGPGDPPGCGPGDPPCMWVWRHPPGVGLETPHRCGPGDTPQVWAWRSPQVWAWRDPTRPRPLNFPPWVWAWRPLPGQTPQLPLLGVGLETCKACWDTTRNTCWDTSPPAVNRILDTRF